MKCRAILLVLFFLAQAASGGSLLSKQYKSTWVAADFLPLGTSQVRIGQIRYESEHEPSFGLKNYLTEQIQHELSSAGLKAASTGDDGAVVVDITVHLYQEGSTLGRWLGGGRGAAYAVVRATYHKAGQPASADLLSLSVIPAGGLYSLGAEKTVLQDVAEDIVSVLKHKETP